MGIRIDEETYARMTGEAAPKPGPKPRRRRKYNAEATEYRGRRYDSAAEARRAEQLDWLKLSGKVAWWEPQVPFTIGDPKVDGRYWVDFLVCEVEPNGSLSIHAEDVKGYATPEWKKQVKRWRRRGPIPLHVIRKGETEIIPRGGEA